MEAIYLTYNVATKKGKGAGCEEEIAKVEYYDG